MKIIRVEGDGTALVIADADQDGREEVKAINWDVLVGCEVTFPERLDPAVSHALEELELHSYETPSPPTQNPVETVETGIIDHRKQLL